MSNAIQLRKIHIWRPCVWHTKSMVVHAISWRLCFSMTKLQNWIVKLEVLSKLVVIKFNWSHQNPLQILQISRSVKRITSTGVSRLLPLPWDLRLFVFRPSQDRLGMLRGLIQAHCWYSAMYSSFSYVHGMDPPQIKKKIALSFDPSWMYDDFSHWNLHFYVMSAFVWSPKGSHFMTLWGVQSGVETARHGRPPSSLDGFCEGKSRRSKWTTTGGTSIDGNPQFSHCIECMRLSTAMNTQSECPNGYFNSHMATPPPLNLVWVFSGFTTSEITCMARWKIDPWTLQNHVWRGFPTAMFDDTGGYAFTSAGVDHRRLHQLRQHFVRRREFGTSLGGAILGCSRPRNPLRKNSIEQLRFLILMVGPQKTGARVGFDASLCGCVSQKLNFKKLHLPNRRLCQSGNGTFQSLWFWGSKFWNNPKWIGEW